MHELWSQQNIEGIRTQSPSQQSDFSPLIARSPRGKFRTVAINSFRTRPLETVTPILNVPSMVLISFALLLLFMSALAFTLTRNIVSRPALALIAGSRTTKYLSEQPGNGTALIVASKDIVLVKDEKVLEFVAEGQSRILGVLGCPMPVDSASLPTSVGASWSALLHTNRHSLVAIPIRNDTDNTVPMATIGTVRKPEITLYRLIVSPDLAATMKCGD